MLSRPHKAHLISNGIARISVVALLLLILLAGLIPSSALSALHTCKMACCAAKPSHEAGACNAVLPSEAQDHSPQATDADEHSFHHGDMQMPGAATEVTVEATTETEVSSGHCQTAKQPSASHDAPPREKAKQSGNVVQAFTKPCALACVAAALNTAQMRRPRESAALSIAVRPRPPTLVSRADDINQLLPSSIERRRQSRPRAPPFSLVNFSA